MNSRRAITILAILLLLVLCSARAAFTQQLPPPQSVVTAQQKSATPTATAIPTYPDSPKGLEKLIKDMVKLQKNNDAQDLALYVQSLVLSDAESDAWFRSEYGDRSGSSLAISYGAGAQLKSQSISAELSSLISSGLANNVDVLDYNQPCASLSFDSAGTGLASLDAAQTDLVLARRVHNPLYGAWFHKGRKSSLLAFFIFSSGGFRYIGVPHAPLEQEQIDETPVVHLEGRALDAKLVHQVLPTYLLDAKETHVQGTVVLHAIISKEGTIQDLTFVRGPQELSRSAMDAVEQWQFSPMMFNGQPVAVDACIPVVYTLGE